MKHFHTVLLAFLTLCALCPHCWAQRRIEEGGRYVAFHPKGNYFATSWGEVKLWSLRGEPLKTVAEPEDGAGHYFRGVTFNPDGTILACATRDSVRLWDVKNPREPKEIKFLGGKVEEAFAVAYSPDGAILAWRTPTDITLWQIMGDKIIGKKAAETSDYPGITFSRDGSALAWATQKKIVIWNVDEPKQAEEVIEAESMGAPAFSPKEDVLVWRERKRVVLWNTKTKKVEHFVIEGGSPGSGVRALAFSPDGKRLAIFGNYILEVRQRLVPFEVLDFASGLTVARFDVPYGPSWRPIAISPNGETLVIGGDSIDQLYIGPPR